MAPELARVRTTVPSMLQVSWVGVQSRVYVWKPDWGENVVGTWVPRS